MNGLSIVRSIKRSIMAVALVLIGDAAAMAQSSRQLRAEETVRSLVEATARAYEANDHRQYFSYFADDITIMNGGKTRWIKKDYVDRWGPLIEKGGGVASLKIEDLQLRANPSGDAVVATFLMPVVSRKPGIASVPDAAPDLVYLMTEVWFRRDRTWTMIHMDWSVRK
jgi:ketosteroid isomerase-like protein